MKMTITKPALNWFKREMDLEKGDNLRFFVRVGGCSTVQDGFSLGMTVEEPTEPALTLEEEGITFFVEQKDIWFFEDQDFAVKFSRKKEEIEFVHGN
ncbi:HesB/YadR/YfhF family protein [Guptibacillus hwajinpoensis]|uniref:HesB/YadR/YfhF family protein n=1 Tax=Guptibacillus hwajinpoensis TaxID=208199 RepID=UPI001CFD7FF2|nr:HesB/YadR/YfhF family protein [Pseudalkalibacillus hwajinpoensis]WLR59861.1 HesB/YadR/YfhF family protein [Pseudalkalibacillus hwajinpoensis]